MSNFCEPLKVKEKDVKAFIERLSGDIPRDKFVREHVQNMIEAISRTGKEGIASITFDRDYWEETDVEKIQFIDNGDGMSKEQLIDLPNSLGASGHSNEYGNHGVGAKISTLPFNPLGVIYESWKNGVGHKICLGLVKEENVYGLIPFINEDGEKEFAISLDDECKPKEIDQHGTRVTLLGSSANENTFSTPPGCGAPNKYWLRKYLNENYFEFPQYVRVQSFHKFDDNLSNTRHNFFTYIEGMKHELDKNSLSNGIVHVPEGKVYWWVLDDKKTQAHGRENLKGTFLINQREIFEFKNINSQRHFQFGISIAKERVVVAIEPTSNSIKQNLQRSDVKQNGHAVDWDPFYKGFKSNFPPELKKFLDDFRAKTTHELDTEDVKKKLNSIEHLYSIKKYVGKKDGKLKADPNSAIEGEDVGIVKPPVKKPDNPQPIPPRPEPDPDREIIRRVRKPINEGIVGNNNGDNNATLYQFLSKGRKKHVRATNYLPLNYPKFDTVEATEENYPDLVDRPAEYNKSGNEIIMNLNFQGYSDIVDFFIKENGNNPQYDQAIRESVIDAFKQAFIEHIFSIRSLERRPGWTDTQVATLLSKEGLMGAIGQKYLMINNIRRAVNNKIKHVNNEALIA